MSRAASRTTLNIDPMIVRLVLLVLALLNGFGVLVYFALWLLVPNEDSLTSDPREQVRENINDIQATAEGLVQRVRNMLNI